MIAVDTSCAVETLALVQGDLVLAHYQARRPTRRGASFASTIEGVLHATGRTLADLQGAVVVTGPGAFTGLRVGIATVQGLASALSIPVWSVGAMEGWAWAACADLVGVTLDARRGEVYTALFRRTGEALEPILGLGMMTPEAWREELASTASGVPVELVGDGARLHRDRLAGPGVSFASPALCGPDLCRAALAGVQRVRNSESGDPRAIAPVYLRLHDGTRIGVG